MKLKSIKQMVKELGLKPKPKEKPKPKKEINEIIKKDKNGNIIYHKYSDDYEEWNEYENNNLIHYKDSNSFEYWSEYDSNNNKIHHKDSDYEYWNEYDSNNNVTNELIKYSDGSYELNGKRYEKIK